MSDKLEMSRKAFDGVADKIQRAYYDPVYRISKAALQPVVDAISDSIRDSISDAVHDGIREAITTTDFVGELFFRKWKKRG